MDLLDVVILALRLLIVALLYLFLVAVLRASARAMAAAMTPVRSAAAHQTDADRLSLIVVEPGTSELAPGQVIAVHDGATFGRAQLADVVLSDATVSAEHARVERVGRAWLVSDLGSTNGTRVNDAPVHGRTPLAAGDVLALGAIRLEVRPH